MVTALEQLTAGPRFTPDMQIDVRLVLFDVDKTLLANNSLQMPSPRFLDGVNQVDGRSEIGLATARQYQKVGYILDAAKFTGRSILSNGAQIYNGETGKMELERTLPPEATLTIAHILQEFKVRHWVQVNGEDHEWSGELAKGRNGLGSYVRSKDIWLPPSEMNTHVEQNYIPGKAFAIVAEDVTEQYLKTMKELAGSYASQKVSFFVAHQTLQPDGTNTYEVFFLHELANKKTALETVLEMTGISPENTMAVGDGHNDIVLVEHVGVGVAVDNAVDELKAVATHIAPAWDKDGAAIALESLVLRR